MTTNYRHFAYGYSLEALVLSRDDRRMVRKAYRNLRRNYGVDRHAAAYATGLLALRVNVRRINEGDDR